MPSGFSVETGVNLSDRLKAVVWQFKDDLMAARAAGSITPAKPLTAREICKMYATVKEDSDVRAMVNYLRRRGCPVASGSQGYFWARTADELVTTRQHLLERRDALDAVIAGVGEAIKKMPPQAEFFR